jgi:hypothetical protein
VSGDCGQDHETPSQPEDKGTQQEVVSSLSLVWPSCCCSHLLPGQARCMNRCGVCASSILLQDFISMTTCVISPCFSYLICTSKIVGAHWLCSSDDPFTNIWRGHLPTTEPWTESSTGVKTGVAFSCLHKCSNGLI